MDTTFSFYLCFIMELLTYDVNKNIDFNQKYFHPNKRKAIHLFKFVNLSIVKLNWNVSQKKKSESVYYTSYDYVRNTPLMLNTIRTVLSWHTSRHSIVLPLNTPNVRKFWRPFWKLLLKCWKTFCYMKVY